MKFGKLLDINDVRFELPPINENNKKILGGSTAKGAFRAFVGCPRWASKEWIGKLYPKGTPQKDYLKFYSQSFNTIELNSTHYRSPKPDLVERWRDMAADGFVFCPKIPQVISHYKKLIQVQEELPAFTDSISLFGEKMGCSFVQLHESFGPSLFPNLEQFAQNWPQSLPLAIEFRHPDWFVHHQLIPELTELLIQHQITPVITDVAGRRDVLHNTLTTKTVMLRFVGNHLHNTDYERVDTWMRRLAQWVDQGLETLYFFAHEPGDELASELGTYVIKQLNAHFDLNLPIPGLPIENSGQMELF